MVLSRATALLGTAAAAASTAGADQPPAQAAPAADAASQAPGGLYRGEVEVVRTVGHTPKQNDAGEEILTGSVFDDVDRDGTQDPREKGLRGVLVSNGRDVVTTDGKGRYEIAVPVNSTVSITQPAGYQVPLDEDNVAQFHYHHLPEGSPDLTYGGLDPTGPLPSQLNFPVAQSDATGPEDQNCIIAGDLQTYDLAEVGFARDGAIKDLSDRDDFPGCGVLFIGDVVGDDLSLYPNVRDLVSTIDAPIRFLPGNHDLDFDAQTAEHSFDTFKAQLAPAYYSYDVGNTHVVALNTVRYPCTPEVDNADGNRPECADPEGDPRYNGRLNDDQLAWLEADLAQVPEDKLILLASHIPLLTYADEGSYIHQVDQVAQIYDIVGDRPAVSVAGHTHSIENMAQGDAIQGWQDTYGIDALPFPHLTSGAISGDWYSGVLTPDGYPVAIGRDGARPGVVTLEIADNEFVERFTGTGLPDEHAMNLGINSPTYRDWFEANAEGDAEPLTDPHLVSTDDLAGTTWLTTNFWMGATGSTVQVNLDGGDPIEAVRTQQAEGEDQLVGAEYSDPYAALQQLVNGGSVADRTMHLWRAELPADLAAGTHVAEVTATDHHGRSFTDTIAFTVTGD